MLSEEKINVNYVNWIDKLKTYDCYSDSLINKYGDKIKVASFSMNENNGAAYQGSMIDVTLHKLCSLGYYINEKAFERMPSVKMNLNMVMRVLLLQHISKCEIFIPQTQSWKLKNGNIFEFNQNLKTKLKCGERSAYMAMNCGINLSDEEFEAITIIDKTDEKGDLFLSPLSVLIKSVNQIINVDLRLEANKMSETLILEK